MNEDNLVASEYTTLTLADLIEEFVQSPEDVHIFRRTGWINRVMLQLVRARCDAGLTQAELGERMGKQQSAIARLERGDDLKLSTLFDYLAALDLVPVGQIATKKHVESTGTLTGSDVSVSGVSAASSDIVPAKELAAD